MSRTTMAIAAGLMLVCTAAAAQRRPSGTAATPKASASMGVLSAEERAAKAGAREQALAELDDADPLVRAGVLEEILKGSDPLLRTFAFRKVLASTDDNLKSMMLRARLTEPKRQFTLELLDCADRERHKTDYCAGALGARTQMPIGFVPAQGSDRVLVFSTMDPRTNAEVRSGTISGSTITFQVKLTASHPYLSECSTTMTMDGAGVLRGRLECSNLVFGSQIRLL